MKSIGWLLAAFALLLSLAWTFASPFGASPDEPAHLVYAWATMTGQTLFGEQLTTVHTGMPKTLVRLPQKLLQFPEPSCYAFVAEKPVTWCSENPPDSNELVTQETYMSRYPPLFYAVEGAVLRLGAGLGLRGSVVLYGARLAAALQCVLAIALGVVLLAKRLPLPAVVLAALLGLPPMAWFLAGSVNSNGLEIAAAFLLGAAVAAVRIDASRGACSPVALCAVPLGALLLAWLRPVSWVWATLLVAVLVVPLGSRDGRGLFERLPILQLGRPAVAFTAVVLAGAAAFSSYASKVLGTEFDAPYHPESWTSLAFPGKVALLLLHSGKIVSEQVGNFGWMDTPLPTIAILGWVLVAGVAVAIWSVGSGSVVPRASLCAFLGLGYLAVMLHEYLGAWGWMGRYVLPLTAAACALSVPGMTRGLQRAAAFRRLIPAMAIALMSIHALSVVWFLFRNCYGLKPYPRRLPPAPLPVGPASWSPPPGQLAILAITALALGCGVVAARKLRADPRPASTPVVTDR